MLTEKQDLQALIKKIKLENKHVKKAMNELRNNQERIHQAMGNIN